MDEIKIGDKANILINALPYIQKYHGKIIVIKYGGNAMLNEELKKAVMRDIVLLSTIGVRIVLVHGGGPEINDMLKRLSIDSKFINGMRYTDNATIEVVQMVLSGKVNKGLVSLINVAGGKAIGLCGCDANMLLAKKLESAVDLGNVGEIYKVNSDIIADSLDKGFIPVIATVATDVDGNTYNINADIAAAAIATSLKAENMILMTDIRGLLHNKDDESTLIPEVTVDQIDELKSSGVISGGMIPKIDCCAAAVSGGVKQALIIDGRIPHAILIEMLTNEGVGTLFKYK